MKKPEKKTFTIADLGPGDGGKGGVVHKICAEKNAHTVVKIGGAQGNHGVRTSRGEHSGFRHFGCGTFEGIKTFISELMVIEPYRLMSEARRLKNEWRIKDIFDYIKIHQDVLCVTPYHTLTSKLRELLRGDKPKGTVGVGVGEAYKDSKITPELAVYAKDLLSPGLRDKLVAVRAQKLQEFQYELSSEFRSFFVGDDLIEAEDLINSFNSENLIDQIVTVFGNLATKVQIVDGDYFRKQILQPDGVIVVEGSHGILNDYLFGFTPHTSALRILPSFTLDMLSNYGYDGEIKNLGVTRAYQFRHGAGPMVTHDPEMLQKLLPGSTKDENRWQGKAMAGPLDFVTLDYSINVCGGPQFFDGLCINWVDQIEALGEWNICEKYEFNDSYRVNKFFTPEGKMKVFSPNGHTEQRAYQSELTSFLKERRLCSPTISTFNLAGKGRKEVQRLIVNTIEEKLQIPVKMISFGPTEKDRILL